MSHHWFATFHDRAGYRGRFLGLVAVGDFLYGFALVVARHTDSAEWWPGSLHELGGLPISLWGIVWMGVAVFVGSGVFQNPRRDYWNFAAAIVLMGIWTLFVINWWWAQHQINEGGWAVAVVWASITTGTYLVSLWPEPPPKERR